MQDTQESRIQPLGWEDPLENEMATYWQCSCWENPMDRGAWWATIHGVDWVTEPTEAAITETWQYSGLMSKGGFFFFFFSYETVLLWTVQVGWSAVVWGAAIFCMFEAGLMSHSGSSHWKGEWEHRGGAFHAPQLGQRDKKRLVVLSS